MKNVNNFIEYVLFLFGALFVILILAGLLWMLTDIVTNISKYFIP